MGKRALNKPWLKTWLQALDIEAHDPNLLFDFLDNGDGQISAQELVGGIARLKGSARSVDLMALMQRHAKVESLVDSIDKRLKSAATQRKAATISIQNSGIGRTSSGRGNAGEDRTCCTGAEE